MQVWQRIEGVMVLVISMNYGGVHGKQISYITIYYIWTYVIVDYSYTPKYTPKFQELEGLR